MFVFGILGFGCLRVDCFFWVFRKLFWLGVLWGFYFSFFV